MFFLSKIGCLLAFCYTPALASSLGYTTDGKITQTAITQERTITSVDYSLAGPTAHQSDGETFLNQFSTNVQSQLGSLTSSSDYSDFVKWLTNEIETTGSTLSLTCYPTYEYDNAPYATVFNCRGPEVTDNDIPSVGLSGHIWYENN